MRLLKSSSPYPAYLRWFYEQRAGLAERSYREQYEALMGDCAFYADFWKRNLEAGNRWEVEEVVVNAEPMQRQWARENGLPDPGSNWREAVLSEQIARFRPDVWFCHSGEISEATRRGIRESVPGIRCVFGYDGVGSNDAAAFAACDTVVCLLAGSCEYYRNAGFRVVPRKLGFEASIVDRLSPARSLYPVSFVGGVDVGARGHLDRLELLARLTRNLELSLFIPRLPAGIQILRTALSTARTSLRDSWRIARHTRAIGRLNQRSSGQVFGRAMFQALRDSLVTLNCHIDIAGNTAANFRLFEATGVGTCLLTDWKSNLAGLFEPDREVVVYRCSEECLEKARYLLDHPEEARLVAERGHRRTLRDHTLAQSIWPVMEAISAGL